MYFVVYFVWILIFFVLTNNNKLFVYNNNLLNKKRIRTIKLDKYKKILSSTNYTQNETTLFKYGFILGHTDDSIHDLLCLFKKNNERYEWMTHIDYALYKCDNNIQNDDAFTMKGNGEFKADDNASYKQLLSILKLYDKWRRNTNKNRETLQKK
eukprot:554260_1